MYCEEDILQLIYNSDYSNAITNATTNDSRLNLVKEINEDFEQLFDDNDRLYQYKQNKFLLAQTFIIPHVKRALARWNPLTHPEFSKILFQECRSLFDFSAGINKDANCLHPYEELFMQTWYPRVAAVTKNFNCREPDDLVILIQCWKRIAPPCVLYYIFDSIILVKLFEIIAQHNNPFMDPDFVNKCIRPWIGLFNARLKVTIYPSVIEQLSHILNQWDPYNNLIKPILELWYPLIGQKEINALLAKYVVPKLQTLLSELIINPEQQNLDKWYSFLFGSSILPFEKVVHLLVHYFFPKFIKALELWICLSENKGFYSTGVFIFWLSEWRRMLGAEYCSHDVIKKNLRTASIMIKNYELKMRGEPAMDPISQEQFNEDIYLSQLCI